MIKQRRLAEQETENAKKAYDSLLGIGSWANTQAGDRFWVQARNYLRSMIEFGTSDGKPYNEPPLSDDYACKRIPIMVRDGDSEQWQGPYVFLSMTDEHYAYQVRNDNEAIPYKFARRLTPDEQSAWEASQ